MSCRPPAWDFSCSCNKIGNFNSKTFAGKEVSCQPEMLYIGFIKWFPSSQVAGAIFLVSGRIFYVACRSTELSMGRLKNSIKNLFRVTRTLFILDKLNFIIAYIKHYKRNKKFKNDNRDFNLPPNYFLYETYKLDYRQYKEDGEVTAGEILEWTSAYLPKDMDILEWGCGVSRVIRHMHLYATAGSRFFACDVNKKMIEWSKNNIGKVEFETIDHTPPTNYPGNNFDLIYGLSVFTHIEKNRQSLWIDEINRIIKPKGIFLFTTHGNKYFEKLDNSAMKRLMQEGSYTISYHKKGHRMMSTFNTYDAFKELIGEKFHILEYYDGIKNPTRAGGQDLWIVQRK